MTNKKHVIDDFEIEDNFVSGVAKHVIQDDFEIQDNFKSDKAKHVLRNFEEEDNFREAN